MIVLKHDIRLMKWSNFNRPAYIFAQAHTMKGKAILLIKGYWFHKTIFGVIMRKEITRIV
jgi:hypothetical protein